MQNASIRAFSARQKSSRSAASGCSAAIASSTPRTSAPSSAGGGVSARQTGQSSPARRTISARIATYSRSAAAMIRSGVSVSDRMVWRIFSAKSAAPRRPSPSLAGRTTSRRWVSKAATAARAVTAAASRRGRRAATAGSADAASAADTASAISTSTPAS